MKGWIFFISNSGMERMERMKMGKNQKMLEINKIMVRKLNYWKNHAELGGQWSNLMVKV